MNLEREHLLVMYTWQVLQRTCPPRPKHQVRILILPLTNVLFAFFVLFSVLHIGIEVKVTKPCTAVL
jgi:hypothetical protein